MYAYQAASSSLEPVSYSWISSFVRAFGCEFAILCKESGELTVCLCGDASFDVGAEVVCRVRQEMGDVSHGVLQMRCTVNASTA